MTLPDSPEAAVLLMWVLTLVLSGVVALVVIGLLYWIYREGENILNSVCRINEAALQTAKNTTKVAQLRTTNKVAEHLLASAADIVADTAQIDAQAARRYGTGGV